jgi:DNA repair exonuclease SbcCD ATPase subunit
MLKDPNLIDKVGGPMLFPQDRSLKHRVTGSGSKAESEQETSVWEILRDIGQKATSPQIVGEGIDASFQQQAQKWEKRIQLQFNHVCSPKEYLGFVYPPNDPSGAPYFKDGDAYYPLSMASSGEQVVLEYITRLTFPRPMNRGLILIDEPEVHLHPGWVRQLYQALPKFGEGNQFIVTTHSAELRAMAAEDGLLVELGDLQH